MDPGLQEINDILKSMLKNDPELRKEGLNSGGRLIDHGWDLIYRKGGGLYISVVDLDHLRMKDFNRNMKIELIENEQLG